MQRRSPRESTINVVVVADIDMLSQDFFRLREQGDMPEMGINFDFDNVTFVLNVLDDVGRRSAVHRDPQAAARSTARSPASKSARAKAKQEATDAREQFTKDVRGGRAAGAEDRSTTRSPS